MNPPTSSPALRSLLWHPRLLLFALVLAGYSIFALLPVLQRKLGLPLSGIWFLDSYAILAASDAVRAGLDPFVANPLDATQRPHSYSSWWFHVGDLGLTREDNPLVGGLWLVAFFAAVFALLRPRTHAEAAWGALLVLSPPVVLAVVRANNDLVVFALLAAGVLALRRGAGTGWLAFFAGMLVLATGLKFYPIVAGLTLLLVRPPRRMLTAGVLTLLAGGATLLAVWGDLKRAVIPAPDGVYTFGAPIIFRDLGWSPAVALGAGLGLLALGATVAWWRGWFIRVENPAEDPGSKLAFACGAAVLVGCFLAGISHAYRLIFVLMLAPLLWSANAGRRRWPVFLVLAAVWLDGLYCLTANLMIGPMLLQELLRLQWVWRLVSQPVIWVSMILLAGTLLELVRSAWSDWRQASRPPAP